MRTGVPDECDIADFPELDCNMNGVLDPCDPDEDNDGIPNGCEDCNSNDTMDWIDLLEGGGEDCNKNSIPDECEPDCNNNDIADECDIAAGTSADIGSNGIPDECEFVPPGGGSTRGQQPEQVIEDEDNDGVPDADDIASSVPMRNRSILMKMALEIFVTTASTSTTMNRKTSMATVWVMRAIIV